ncbi:MAG: MarR family transcriptional regulator, partial [Microbacterium sp.]
MAAADADVDDALAEFQSQLNLIFARARSLWKESAARIHPELQPAGYKLLAFVARMGSASAHQLVDSFEMDKSVVSRQVRMLEDVGLLVSRPDERDGRLRVLTATPEAVAALARVRGDHAERMR